MSPSLHALSDWVRCRTKGWPCSLSPHWRRTFLKVTRKQSWWLSCRNKYKQNKQENQSWDRQIQLDQGSHYRHTVSFSLVVSVQSSVHFSGQDVPDVEGSISWASSHIAAVRTATKQRYGSTFWAFDERVMGKLGCIVLQSTAAAANSPVSDSGPVSSTFKPLGTKVENRRKSC